MTRWIGGELVAGAFLAAFGSATMYALGPEPLSPAEVRVVDGDTVELLTTGQRYRLVGIDTPESYRPACEAERLAGERAKVELIILKMGAHAVEILPTGAVDRWKRPMAKLMLYTPDGPVDAGAAMVASGHAEEWAGRRRWAERLCP